MLPCFSLILSIFGLVDQLGRRSTPYPLAFVQSSSYGKGESPPKDISALPLLIKEVFY
jgi:hypothetical protein